MQRVLPLLVLGVAAGLPACPEDDYARVRRPRGPEIESAPTRPRSVVGEAPPSVEWVPVPGAPVEGAVHDAHGVGLGGHVAVIRLVGRSDRRVTLVTLETEQRDPALPAVVRREVITDPRGYDRGTVRYREFRFRQDRVQPGGRHLRVRLRSVDLASGPRFVAPPWSEAPAPRPEATTGRGSPAAVLDRISHGIRGLTEQLRKVNEKPRERR